MTPDETTHIEFAERQGWKKERTGELSFMGKTEYDGMQLPNPTDHNHVHTALMGMSEEEWASFSLLILRHHGWLPNTQGDWNGEFEDIITDTLKTPLSTLVSCYLEATKGRTKP